MARASGESRAATATFRNVGGTALTIESVKLPSSPFGAEGVPAAGATIEPGGSVTSTVLFDPNEIGQSEGKIELDTSAGSAVVVLTGVSGAPGALDISAEANEYGEVPVSSSATRTFTITNTGGTTVEITKSKPPSGGAFTATTSLAEGSTIGAGESVTESVTFAPTVPGDASGVWLINGKNDTTGLHEVRFSGLGTIPEVPVEAPVLTPSSQQGPQTLGPLPAQGVQAFQGDKAPTPTVALQGARLTAGARGVLLATISCPAADGSCHGTITLRTLTAVPDAGGAAHRRGRRRPALLTLAIGSFTVAEGGTGDRSHAPLPDGACVAHAPARACGQRHHPPARSGSRRTVCPQQRENRCFQGRCLNDCLQPRFSVALPLPNSQRWASMPKRGYRFL